MDATLYPSKKCREGGPYSNGTMSHGAESTHKAAMGALIALPTFIVTPQHADFHLAARGAIKMAEVYCYHCYDVCVLWLVGGGNNVGREGQSPCSCCLKPLLHRFGSIWP